MGAALFMNAIVSAYLPFLYFVVVISATLNVYLLFKISAMVKKIHDLLLKRTDKDE